jgi:hypothetical protein
LKGSGAPWEYWRVVMCERFGWRLDYWDELTTDDVYQIIAVWDGIQKAESNRRPEA